MQETLDTRIQAICNGGIELRTKEVVPFLDEIWEQGLTAPTLVVFLKSIIKSEDELANICLRALIPCEPIPAACIEEIVRYIRREGEQKLTERLILWLVLAFDFIEDHSVFDKHYSTFFSCLYMDSLQSWNCYLLYKCTKAANVTMYRLEVLHRLCQKYKSNEYLASLFEYFRSFIPGIKVGSKPLPKAKTATELFIVLNRSYIHRMRKHISKSKGRSFFTGQRHRTFHSSVTRGAQSGGGRLTSYATFSEYVGDRRPGLEQIDSLEEFVDSVDQIVFPKRIASLFGAGSIVIAPMLLHLSSEPSGMDRIDRYLQARAVFRPSGSDLEDMLEALSHLVTQLNTIGKGGIMLLETAIRAKSRVRNVDAMMDTVLKCAEYYPLPYDEKQANDFIRYILTPLVNLFNQGADPDFALGIKVLAFFRRIVLRWGTRMHMKADIKIVVRFLDEFVEHGNEIASLLLSGTHSRRRKIGPQEYANIMFEELTGREAVKRPKPEAPPSSVYTEKFGSSIDNYLLCDGILALYEALLDNMQREWIIQLDVLDAKVCTRLVCSYNKSIISRLVGVCTRYEQTMQISEQNEVRQNVQEICSNNRMILGRGRLYYPLAQVFDEWSMPWSQMVACYNHPAFARIGWEAVLESEEQSKQVGKREFNFRLFIRLFFDKMRDLGLRPMVNLEEVFI